MKGFYTELLSIPAKSKTYMEFFISQASQWSPLIAKDLINKTWVVLTGAALYTSQDDTADPSQAMCPIDFSAGNQTLDLLAGSVAADSTWQLTPQLLMFTTAVAVPLGWYLVKKLQPYLCTKSTVTDPEEKHL